MMQRMRCLLLIFLPLLVLCACAAASDSTAAPTDEALQRLPLAYATQYTVDYYPNGCALITIGGDTHYLSVPQGEQVPESAPQDAVVLPCPAENIYLVSTSVMDFFIRLEALDTIALSGTSADGWYLDAAKEAMQSGQIAFAGKYSAPDYEKILAADCGLAIENTMIYHTPEVKEELEALGIPVLVERSSYESDPLARMEWIKLYGVLLGRESEAERIFAEAEEKLQPILAQESTGTTAAFFSITSNGLATVRKGGDYVARMIEMAGGHYVFADLTEDGNNLATMNLPLENFYAGAKDADVLIYNATIEGEIHTLDALLEKCPMLADFAAVQSGRVYCTGQNLFQQTMSLGDLLADMHTVFAAENPDEADLTCLQKIL